MLPKTFIDLFCGMGGFRLAGGNLGLECVFSSEIDEAAKDTYEKNFGERPDGDITKVIADDIPDHDILCGGFPCQSFSIAGVAKRIGLGQEHGFADKTKGTLFFDVIRIAAAKRPSALLLENVWNLASHDGGKTLSVIVGSLRDIGYRVYHKVISSSGFGVPTPRKRIYFACFRSDLGVGKFTFPASPCRQTCLRDLLLPDDMTDQYVYHGAAASLRCSSPEASDSLFDICPQQPVRVGEIADMGHHQGYRIYSSYGHAITLSSSNGGVAANTGLYVVNDRIRSLAPRECARIMGFPDDFILPENDIVALRQIGNSVVVPVVESIMRSIIEVIT